MKNFKFFVLLIFYGFNAFSEPTKMQGAISIGSPEGVETFTDYTADKFYAEVLFKSDCNQDRRQFLHGGCELTYNSQPKDTAILIGSYPVLKTPHYSQHFIEWNCKYANIKKGDTVRVRTLCQ